MIVDVNTTQCLTREQSVQAQQALKAIVSTPTLQVKFDELEAKANGDAEAYAVMLPLMLRTEVYPQVCEQFGISREQLGAGVALILESIGQWARDDLAMLETWVELERLMRNKNIAKMAQSMMEAKKEAVRRSTPRPSESEVVDVSTTQCLTREQSVRAQQLLKAIVSTSTLQAEFDQLEVKAKGDVEAYAVMLSFVLRSEVYPRVCEQFGIPQEQAGAGTKLIFDSIGHWARHDLEMLENWMELETLMRNKKSMKAAQSLMETAKKEAVRRSTPCEVKGEADLVYPVDGSPEEFGKAIADSLAHKGFCMVQMSENKETRERAVEAVIDDGAEIQEYIMQELESAYLGRSNITYVKALPPDMMADDLSPLKVLSQQALSALNAVGLHTEEYLNHSCWATTSLWARVSSETDTISDPPSLQERDDIEGSIQAYERFVLGRKVCVLYMVENAGGEIYLYPRGNSSLAAAGSGALKIPISENRMLLFRHDQMSYSYQPKGPSLALQSWLLTDIPFAQQNLKIAPLTGVKEPPAGENAQIMMLCSRMPGQADGAEKLWQMFASGSDTDVPWPDARFEIELYYTAEADYTGKSYTYHGAFIDSDHLIGIDHAFFGASKDEACVMAPGQRLVLQVGYECLYQAGHTRNTLAGENIGVFLGDSGMDWAQFNAPWSVQFHGTGKITELCAGIHNGVTAARLSHTFDMRGSIQTADTACSSALVALQAGHKAMTHNATMAIQSDNIGAPHSILSGGVNTMLTPGGFAAACGSGMLTHGGRCFTFDRTADGYQRGEGTGFMFIKWSSDLMDIEERLACLVGTCSGHDGRSASLTAPNGPAQQDVIRRSMRMAGLDPSLLSVCECHGTGTPLGDPIEIGSLQGVMRGMRTFPLLNTSAKTNISHLEPAAGIAGIMKCVLMVMHSCGPPNCHLNLVNPNLETEGYPVFFQQELCDTTFSTTFIGVSSFGFGGTNSRADVYGRCLYGAANTGNVWTYERMESRSLAYAHGLRNTYKGYNKLSEKVVSQVPISIIGSWDDFENVADMKQEEPGCFTYRFTLTDTRRACFQLCMAGNRSQRLYPAVDEASSTALICGPGSSGREDNHKWLIDGRNDAAHEGTKYCITFKWQGEKSISWASEGEGDQKIPTKEYFIFESSARGEPRKMSCCSEEDGLHEGEFAINAEGKARFRIQCADESEQAIYPDESGAACGPDRAGKGKYFEVCGSAGQIMKVRLRVKHAHVSVLIFSDRGIEASWVSNHVKAYYVTGSFNGWRSARLYEDRFIKGLYKFHVDVLKDDPIEYKICADVDWSSALQSLSAVFPEADPEVLDAERDFKGRVCSSWEIILDLNQDDPDRMIYHRPATHMEDNTVISM